MAGAAREEAVLQMSIEEVDFEAFFTHGKFDFRRLRYAAAAGEFRAQLSMASNLLLLTDCPES